MKLRTAAAVLHRSGLGAVLRRAGRWRGVLVLNYHRIGDPTGSPYERNIWSATPEQFDDQLGVLARETDVIGPGDLPAAAGTTGRRVLVTFDDGYRDNHDIALPLLRRHGVPATFFLAVGLLDRPRAPWWDEIAWMVRTSDAPGVPALDGVSPAIRWVEPDRERAVEALTTAVKRLAPDALDRFLDRLGEATGTGRCDDPAWATEWMTWDMARALRDAGMGIGGHSVDHPVLATLDEAGQRREIEGCARRLREELDLPMRLFSYPVGLPDSYDATTRRLLAEQGVELAFAFAGGIAGRGPLDRLAVERTSVSNYLGPADFRAIVTAPAAFARW